MWSTDTDDFGFVNAIVNGNLRLHIVPGTVKNAESVPVVVALLNRAEAAEAKVHDIQAALTDYERRATSLLEVMRVAGCLEGK